MTAWFVTSSGTEIGKTLVVSVLARALRRRAVPVHAIKPVITGFTPETAEMSDTARILDALDLAMTGKAVAKISPWRFAAPLSPDMAAGREGRTLELDEIVAFCRGAAAADTVLLVEGIGGVMVPLNDRATVLDLMAALGFPAILVVGSYLGALSHSLTAASALAGRGVDLAAMVVSETDQSPVRLAETADVLGRFLDPAPVIALPRLAGEDGTAEFAAALISALGLTPAP